MAARELHSIVVDGREVQLRVFKPAPESNGNAGVSKPAVVMVCGLMWLGGGAMGRIGLAFNDLFGYAFARNGVPCVQIHTPSRHMAHTWLLDLNAVLCWPLTWLPSFALPFLLADVIFLAASVPDLLFLLLAPFASALGPLALPALHLALRAFQRLQGTLPAPAPANHQKEIAAAVSWTQANQAALGSDGRLAFCGYSSGGHCAALFAASPAAPKFCAVVLISGIYSLQTGSWKGLRRALAPAFNLLYRDVLGVRTEQDRQQESPEITLQKVHQGQEWYVLNAKMELMGLQPVQDIFFNSEPLCSALVSKGAVVHRVQCGLNHWFLVAQIGEFIAPFCAKLKKKA